MKGGRGREALNSSMISNEYEAAVTFGELFTHYVHRYAVKIEECTISCSD